MFLWERSLAPEGLIAFPVSWAILVELGFVHIGHCVSPAGYLPNRGVVSLILFGYAAFHTHGRRLVPIPEGYVPI